MKLTFTGKGAQGALREQIGRPAQRLSEAMAGSFVICAFGSRIGRRQTAARTAAPDQTELLRAAAGMTGFGHRFRP
jgi:hypothetical protein